MPKVKLPGKIPTFKAGDVVKRKHRAPTKKDRFAYHYEEEKLTPKTASALNKVTRAHVSFHMRCIRGDTSTASGEKKCAESLRRFMAAQKKYDSILGGITEYEILVHD